MQSFVPLLKHPQVLETQLKPKAKPKSGGAWINPGQFTKPTPAGPTASAPQDLATFLATVAIPDLQNALNLANAQTPPDATAAACWSALIPIATQVQSQLQTNASGQAVIGIATAVQIARDLLNTANGASPILKQVNLGCAPLYVDTKVGILNLGAQLGGVLAGAAVLAPIKPLPLPVVP
jgi:hypothetical protein